MSRAIVVRSGRASDRDLVETAVGEVFKVRGDEAALRGADVVVVAYEKLREVLPRLDESRPVVVLADLVPATAAPPIAHVIRRDAGVEPLRALLLSIAEQRPLFSAPGAPPETEADARRIQRAFAASRRLAAVSDLAASEGVMTDAVVELTGADRAYCLFHDADDGSIWSEHRRATPAGDERRAIAGLAGFAARTGLSVQADRAEDDPRWVASIDDPSGDEAARLLVQPVVGSAGQIHAVLVAARSGRRAAFAEADAALIAAFAGFAAPFLDQLSTHIEAQAVIEAAGDDQLFRKEAIDAQALPRWGDVVRVSPSWISWAYWVLVALLAASMVYISVGTISTYSEGPAIVRSTSRSDVTARTAGNVTAITVAPGDAIARGDVIARLDDTDARGSVERLEREFEIQLRNHMLDPADASADQALRGLRLQIEQARLGLEDRTVLAPAAGVVADIRVHPGQRVEPGQIIVSVVDPGAGLEVVGLLPGSHRPQLAPGMDLRLELAGYRYAYQNLRIDSVSTEVLPPAEAMRQLGPEAGGLRLAEPVVVVRARIQGVDFEADGRRFHYHDGMLGHAEVRVREERILFTLVPGLQRL